MADAAQSTEERLAEEERLRNYEMTAILSLSAEEAKREAVLDTIRRIITDERGELIEVTPAKTRTLAYPINKERQAVFATLVFRAPTTVPRRIADAFKHDTTLLRHMLTERPRVQATAKRGRETKPREKPVDETRMEEQIEQALKSTE